MTLMAPHHEMSVLYEPPGMVSQPPVYPADVRGGRCHIMRYEGGTARPLWNAGQDGWWTLGRKTQSTCPLIDSLRRDPGGTITADCPPSPTGPSLWNKNVSSHTKKQVWQIVFGSYKWPPSSASTVYAQENVIRGRLTYK